MNQCSQTKPTSSESAFRIQVSEGATDGLDQSLLGDPDYGRTTIGRIIASEHARSGNTSEENDFQQIEKRRYLVKWQGLPYDEASWEWEEELRVLAEADFDRAVADFHARHPIADDQALQNAQVPFHPMADEMQFATG